MRKQTRLCACAVAVALLFASQGCERDSFAKSVNKASMANGSLLQIIDSAQRNNIFSTVQAENDATAALLFQKDREIISVLAELNEYARFVSQGNLSDDDKAAALAVIDRGIEAANALIIQGTLFKNEKTKAQFLAYSQTIHAALSGIRTIILTLKSNPRTAALSSGGHYA